MHYYSNEGSSPSVIGNLSRFWLFCICHFIFLLPKTLFLFLLSNFLTMSVLDEVIPETSGIYSFIISFFSTLTINAVNITGRESNLIYMLCRGH